MKTWTILEVLDWTKRHFEEKGIESPRLDAEVILAHALGIPRIMLYARFDQPLGDEERARVRELVARRVRREPVAYLVGEKEFWSLPFEVSKHVLIPRADSETLVTVALEAARRSAPKVIADVGTGSGCLAVALAKELPDARIFALDVSPDACAVAKRNVEHNGVLDRVTVLESDLLAALPGVSLDLCVANLPYIASDRMADLMPDVRAFEPRGALDGGRDGLDLIRRLLAGLEGRMTAGGTLILEADPDQMTEIARLSTGAGFVDPTLHDDLTGRKRALSARAVDRRGPIG